MARCGTARWPRGLLGDVPWHGITFVQQKPGCGLVQLLRLARRRLSRSPGGKEWVPRWRALALCLDRADLSRPSNQAGNATLRIDARPKLSAGLHPEASASLPA